jgi:hypothetical protein
VGGLVIFERIGFGKTLFIHASVIRSDASWRRKIVALCLLQRNCPHHGIKRAETARLELLKSLDAFVADVKTRPDYDSHAERFRKSVDIVVMRLDLADLSTVVSFADELMSKYVLYLVGFALL